MPEGNACPLPVVVLSSAAPGPPPGLTPATPAAHQNPYQKHPKARLRAATDSTGPTSSSSGTTHDFNNNSNSYNNSIPEVIGDHHQKARNKQPKTFSQKWTATILCLQTPVRVGITQTSLHAARHPRWYLVLVTVASLALVVAGLMTNFVIEQREQELWTPRGSRPEQHQHWIETVWEGQSTRRRLLLLEEEERITSSICQSQQTSANDGSSLWNPFSGEDEDQMERTCENNNNSQQQQQQHPSRSRYLQADTDGNQYIFLMLHADGANVVSQEGAAKQFEAIDRIRSVPGYQQHCAQYGGLPCPPGVLDLVCFLNDIPFGNDAPRVCNMVGMTAFWFHNTSIFEREVESDYDVYKTLAIDIFPGDSEVFDVSNYVGYPKFETVNGTKLLVEGLSYTTYMPLPHLAAGLEQAVIDEVLLLQEEWENDPNNMYRVELVASESFEDELLRAILTDLPLMPFVAILMSAFTALVFFQRSWLHSRTTLGVGAVLCVMLSLLSGYGMMFIIGIPFTNLQLALL